MMKMKAQSWNKSFSGDCLSAFSFRNLALETLALP
jgi:hypothetical protein